MRYALYICVEELLELRRSLLLSATIVGIVVIEQALPESPLPRQGVVDGALAGIAVEFAPLAAFQEKKVKLSVVVARRALWQMEHQARECCQYPNPDAPHRHKAQADEEAMLYLLRLRDRRKDRAIRQGFYSRIRKKHNTFLYYLY